MTTPAACAHVDTIPVETIEGPTPGQETAPVITVTGHRCLTCSEVLPPEWGCTDCTWFPVLLLAVPCHTVTLAARCPTHERG